MSVPAFALNFLRNQVTSMDLSSNLGEKHIDDPFGPSTGPGKWNILSLFKPKIVLHTTEGDVQWAPAGEPDPGRAKFLAVGAFAVGIVVVGFAGYGIYRIAH